MRRPQLEQDLDSAPSDDMDPVGKETNSMVKIMEKKSHVFVVDNYTMRAGIVEMDKSIHIDRDLYVVRGTGNSIESKPFVMGEYSFTFLLYPHGSEPGAGGRVALFLKNQSCKTARVAFQLLFLDRLVDEDRCVGSTLYVRDNYQEVVTVEPGCCFGTRTLILGFFLKSRLHGNNSIMFKANIGLVIDRQPRPQPQPPQKSLSLERCLLFQVGDRTYYAQESVITTRCPALLSYSQSNVVISDVETDVFEAVLWFLNHRKLHHQDREAIVNAKDSFDLKIIAAAEKFMLKDLGRLCKSLMRFGDSDLVELYYETEAEVKELWRNLSRGLPQKMEELIPQKMKVA